MNPTPIPWADFTWNPTTGCTFGCDYCYARRVAEQFGPEEAKHYPLGPLFVAMPGEVFPSRFAPTIYPHRLDEPLRRKKPAVIFLGSMGDLFDPAFPDSFRDLIFRTVLGAEQHTFVVLTKRADAMHRYFSDAIDGGIFGPWTRPVLPNLVIGVSVTNQSDADERIPLLLATPAAKRMVSVEPMLGPVNLSATVTGVLWGNRPVPLDFVAVGGKTPGPALHEQWSDDPDTAWAAIPISSPRGGLRSLRDQCLAAGVPFHYKHGDANPALDGVVYDAEVPR